MKRILALTVASVATALSAVQLMTEWGEKVTSGNCWRDYPRPQMVRSDWTCLNGDWDYAITSVTNTSARPSKWMGKIRVPYAIESVLSGVGRKLEENEFLWYTRTVDVKKSAGKRNLLHFDGVDFRAMVFIGHNEVTDVPHYGAQEPFTLDITDYVKDGANELTVCVWDPTEGYINSRGKQSRRPAGCHYTRVSGIWQTVWMETVPETHIADYKVVTDIDKGEVTLSFDVKSASFAKPEVEVEVAGIRAKTVDGRVTVKMPKDFKLWSPEAPNLYDFTAKCGFDKISGYFGMRKFEKRKDAKGILRFFLNNKPYFIIGTLDQGWWPDGLLTPPSDEAMRYDIATLRKCGFNMMRKHIKVEPLRYYHLCDKLGIIVLQDLPCNEPDWGEYMRNGVVRNYGFQRLELKRMIDELQKVPSIVMWIPYNEGWTQPGEFLTHSTLDFIKRYDPTRLVNGPSGCNDWEGGQVLDKGWKWNIRNNTSHKPAGECEAADAVDLHLYRSDNPDGIHGHCTMFPVNDRRVSFLGEFGGLGHPVEGHVYNPKSGSWGYGGTEDTKTLKGLEKTYLALMDNIAELAVKGLGGSVYTQTTDVEIEINGIMTYDRKVLKYNADVIRAAHEKIVKAAYVAAVTGKDADKPVVETWNKTKNGEVTHLYTLTRGDGLKLVVSDFGGRLVQCWAPDRNGKLADVTLGWNSVGEYEKLGFSMGTLIGRFGNRIRDGRFVLDGKEYRLPINEVNPAPRHCNLHSGPIGWDAKVWKVESATASSIVLSLVSPDGDMGFPGTVKAYVTYEVLPGNIWRITYDATTDKPTVLNLTHHTYWNMAGESSGSVLDQLLKVNADMYTQTDAGLIPTQNAKVEGTGMDFRELRPIGAKADLMKAEKAFAAMDNWYDHNFVLNGKNGEMKLAAEMKDPKSGRTLDVWTTEPCMQMYGAQNVSDDVPAKAAGKHLCQFAGVALETQHYPDSPNHPEFPTTVLRPGEKFHSVTEYRFSAE